MSKLLSILIAAVFAVSTGYVFAESNMKAAGDKKDEMKKEEKSEMKKEAKKAPKAKKEMKKDEKKEEKK